MAASVVGSWLKVELRLVLILEAVEPAEIVLVVVLGERPAVLVDAC